MASDAKKEAVQDSPQHSGQDAAYTVNHAIVCTTSDMLTLGPLIGAAMQTFLGRFFPSREAHERDSGHQHSASAWWVGEAVGDFTAVPVTLAIQHFAPGAMTGLRGVMEPVLGPAFRWGAERSARKWATENGMRPDSAEAKHKEREIYSYEMEHLPQAAVWTATSVALNIATQKKVAKNDAPWLHLLAGKMAETLFSTALVVSGRAAFPYEAHRWDNFAAQHVFDPATKAVAGAFGVDSDAVDALKQERQKVTPDPWKRRVAAKETVEAQRSPG